MKMVLWIFAVTASLFLAAEARGYDIDAVLREMTGEETPGLIDEVPANGGLLPALRWQEFLPRGVSIIEAEASCGGFVNVKESVDLPEVGDHTWFTMPHGVEVTDKDESGRMIYPRPMPVTALEKGMTRLFLIPDGLSPDEAWILTMSQTETYYAGGVPGSLGNWAMTEVRDGRAVTMTEELPSLPEERWIKCWALPVQAIALRVPLSLFDLRNAYPYGTDDFIELIPGASAKMRVFLPQGITIPREVSGLGISVRYTGEDGSPLPPGTRLMMDEWFTAEFD